MYKLYNVKGWAPLALRSAPEARGEAQELNCGDLTPHIQATCVYAVAPDGHIPARNPWPSDTAPEFPSRRKRRSARAPSSLTGRPFHVQPQIRMRAEPRPRRRGTQLLL